MNTQKIQNFFSSSISNKSILRIGIMLILIAIFIGFIFWQNNPSLPNFLTRNEETSSISREMLMSDYGFRVRLIGVTAAGGLIDVRFKVLDKDKAAVLLNNPDTFPELIAEDGTIIKVPVESIQEMHLEDNGIVFMLFPNIGGVVTPGSLVNIRFGDIVLEPILAQ